MPRQSAGLLLYRRTGDGVEVLLVHPGGPYWSDRDDGAWTIPKGELEEDEEPLATARREFEEETGVGVTGEEIALNPVRQPGGKIVHAWAVDGDLDTAAVRSNTFSMEWPPRSGKRKEFPEIDRAEWFSLESARRKILEGQLDLLEQLEERLG